jgi:hypothetical protein
MPNSNRYAKKGFLTTRSALFWGGVAVLAFSISVLATSTYAWYKLADLLVVDDIAVQYSGSQAFKIGMKDSSGTLQYPNYVDMNTPQVIDNSTLKEYAGFTGTEVLKPVSGMYQNLWLNSSTVFDSTVPTFRSGYFSASNIHEADLAAKTSYLQFEFYFYCDRDCYVFLSDSSTLTANHQDNLAIANANGLSVDDLDKVANSTRISFYSEDGYTIWEPNVATGGQTPYAGRLNLTNDNDYFDTQDGKEILFGDYTCDHLVYDDEGRSTSMSGNGTAFDALSDPNAQALDLAKSQSEGGLVIQNEKSYTLTDLALTDSTESTDRALVYCPMGVAKRLVVSLYVEGWDRDTIETIGYAKFSLNLAFTGLLKSKE